MQIDMKKSFVPNQIELARDIQKDLMNWKKIRHQTVLQLEGPRQVGKTHEVQKFAYANYEHVIYVNLVRDEYCFEDALSSPDFMEEYCKRAGLPEYTDDNSTVLIIDEIQEKSTVYNAIRDIRERLSCDVIVSGSYLARTVNSRDFFLPAGIAYLRMFPLSFREFCRALGIEQILDHLNLYSGSDGESYEKLESAYRVYRHIGGYPQVVTTYLETRSEAECLTVLEDLIRTFTAESSRFFTNSTAMSVFHEVYRAVMVEILLEKKGTGKSMMEYLTEFVKTSVKEPVSRNEVRMAASWLLYSGVIGYCDLYNNGDVMDVVSDRRIYFADSGIAWCISQSVTAREDAIEGMLTETFAYTELNRLYQMPVGYRKVRGNKPCFSICGDYELDFAAVGDDHTRYGLEIKSGDNASRSLVYFKEKGLIDKAFRAGTSRGGHGQIVDTIPIYTVGARFPYQ